MGAGVAGGAAGVYTGDIAQLGQFGTILSLLRYNRVLEAEADAMGVRLLAEQGYDPRAMAETWAQLIAEEELSAKYRRKRRRRDIGLFGTHPTPESRMADLRISAAEVMRPGRLLRRAPCALRRRDREDPPVAARRPGQAQRPRGKPICHQHAGQGWLERAAALPRVRDLAAAQPHRRRYPRRAGLCERGALPRCARRRVALARDHAAEGGAHRRGARGARAAIWRWPPMPPTPHSSAR